MQGIVSLFMPAVMGIIADRWVPAQKLLGFCHFMGAVFMIAAGYYGMASGDNTEFVSLLLCTLSVWHFICLHWHSLILWHIQHWIK